VNKNTKKTLTNFQTMEESVNFFNEEFSSLTIQADSLSKDQLTAQYTILKSTFESMNNSFNELFGYYTELKREVEEFRKPYFVLISKLEQRIFWILISVLFIFFANLEISSTSDVSIPLVFGVTFSDLHIHEIVVAAFTIVLFFHFKICWFYYVVLSQTDRLHGDVYEIAKKCSSKLGTTTLLFRDYIERHGDYRGDFKPVGISANQSERYKITINFDSDRKKISSFECIGKGIFGFFLTIFSFYLYNDVLPSVFSYMFFNVIMLILFVFYIFPFALNFNATCLAIKVLCLSFKSIHK